MSAPGPVFSNWAGNVTFRPADFVTPSDEAALVSTVMEVAARGGRLRVVGAAHSFTPLIATDQTLVSLDALSGLLAVDAERHRVTVRAGTRLGQLGALLHAEGLAQENLGDIDTQSLAGALATGTHGTGARLGGLVTQVVGLDLVTAAGDTLHCSADSHPDVFQAARLSLGALGVVSAVTLQAVPSYRLSAFKTKARLDHVLGSLAGLLAASRHFEFFWFPYTNSVQIKQLNATESPAAPLRLGQALNELVIENGAFWLMNEVVRRVPALAPRAAAVAAAFIGDEVRTDFSHRIFATKRLVRFVEMEYALSADALQPVLAEIRAVMDRERFAVAFPIEVRFGASDDVWLSPAYGRDTVYVAVHQYRGMAHQPYFDAIEAIFRAHGGRPHWGKLHSLTGPELAERYPQWEAFQTVRRRLDPAGVFMNDHLARLMGAN